MKAEIRYRYFNKSGDEIPHDAWLKLTTDEEYSVIQQYLNDDGTSAQIRWLGVIERKHITDDVHYDKKDKRYTLTTIFKNDSGNIETRFYHCGYVSELRMIYENFLAMRSLGEWFPAHGGGEHFVEYGNRFNPTEKKSIAIGMRTEDALIGSW